MEDTMTIIRNAISENNNIVAKQLLSKNPELINIITLAGGTLLHDAVRFNNEEMAEFLIENGVDVEIEAPASGICGVAINCANSIGMAEILLRRGLKPTLDIEDKEKNPLFRSLYGK